MPLVSFLETRLNWDPERKARDIVAGVKEILVGIGQWWMDTCFEGHFVPSAVAKYGYPPRTRLYEIRKGRKWGHRRPLIWSGSFYAAAKTGRLAAPKQGKDVVLKLLFRGGFTNRKGHNVRQDLFAKTPAETRIIQKYVAEGCTEFIRRPEPAMKPVSRLGA